jgi:rubrerythrin
MNRLTKHFTQFSLKQLLAAAILKEEESISLYTALFEKSTITSVKKLFSQLRQQEKKHRTFYNTLMKKIDPKNEIAINQKNEYTICMMNFLEEHRMSFFVTSDHITSVFQAIDYAILREKHSILFYTGLRHYAPLYARQTVDAIIEEEIQHAEKLIQLKEKMQLVNCKLKKVS